MHLIEPTPSDPVYRFDLDRHVVEVQLIRFAECDPKSDLQFAKDALAHLDICFCNGRIIKSVPIARPDRKAARLVDVEFFDERILRLEGAFTESLGIFACYLPADLNQAEARAEMAKRFTHTKTHRLLQDSVHLMEALPRRYAFPETGLPFSSSMYPAKLVPVRLWAGATREL
jgi:hypothetical protein